MTNQDMDKRLWSGAKMIKYISRKGVSEELGDTGDPGHLFGGCAMLLVDDVLVCFHRERDQIGVSAPVPPDEVAVIPPVLGPRTIVLGRNPSRRELVSAAKRQARSMKALYAEMEVKASTSNRKCNEEEIDREYDKFYGPR